MQHSWSQSFCIFDIIIIVIINELLPLTQTLAVDVAFRHTNSVFVFQAVYKLRFCKPLDAEKKTSAVTTMV